MLVRERGDAVVFRGGIRVLPQFHVEVLLILCRIRQRSGLHLDGVGECERRFHPVCGGGQRGGVGAGLGVLRYGERYPDVLHLIGLHRDRAALVEDVVAFGAVGLGGGGHLAVRVSVAEIAAVVCPGGLDERGRDVAFGDDVAALRRQVVCGDRQVRDGGADRGERDLAVDLVVLPCFQRPVVRREGLHLVEPLLRVLRIGVHDAAGQVRCHPGDGDVDDLADAGRSRGHGDGGGSRRDRGDRAICADCGDTRVAARVGHVIDGRVIGRHRIRDPLAVANAQRHRGRVECDAGDHVRLMGHDDLGAVDQRVRGIRVPLACGHRLEHVLTFVKPGERRDFRLVDVGGVVQAVRAFFRSVNIVFHLAHGPVLACIDVDCAAEESDRIPDVLRREAVGWRLGPRMHVVARIPGVVGEREVVAVAGDLGVRDGGGLHGLDGLRPHPREMGAHDRRQHHGYRGDHGGGRSPWRATTAQPHRYSSVHLWTSFLSPLKIGHPIVSQPLSLPAVSDCPVCQSRPCAQHPLSLCVMKDNGLDLIRTQAWRDRCRIRRASAGRPRAR